MEADNDGFIREPNYFDKEYMIKVKSLLSCGEYLVLPTKSIRTGEKGAVKILSLLRRDNATGKRQQDPCREELARAEASLWQELSGHPNVMKLRLAILQDQCCLFVMESCQCSLSHKVHSGNLSRKDSQTLLRQALLGVKACHDAQIANRRVSLETFLVAKDGSTVKLCDLGSAARVPLGGGKLRGSVGDVAAMSPEMLRGGEYGTDTDMWSYGVMAYTALFHQHPFLHGDEVDDDALRRAVCAGEMRPRCAERSAEDSEGDATALLSRLLSLDPARRPSAAEALGHAYLRAATPSEARSPSEEWGGLLVAVCMCVIFVGEVWALWVCRKHYIDQSL